MNSSRMQRGLAMTVLSAALVTSLSTAAAAPLARHSATASHAPLTLDWYMWAGSDAEVKSWEADAALVTAKYPDIKIHFIYDTWPTYWTKLGSKAASNTLPDIVSLQCGRTGGFASSFRPLEPYMRSTNFDLQSFDKGIISALSYQGSVRALPYDFGPIVIFYNKAMFKKYHLATPSLTWTYAEFLKDAKAMTSGKDYGFMANPYPDDWLPFAMSGGGQYIDKSGALTLTDAKLISGFQEYAKLRYQYKVSPVETATLNNPQIWQGGNIGMVADGPWDMLNFKANVKFPFGIATIPSQNGRSVTDVCGSGFGISTASKHPDEAWKAISVLTGAQAQQLLATQGRAFTARIAQQKYWYQNAVPGAQQVLDWQLKHSVALQTTPNWQQVSSLILQYGTAVVNGGQSAQSALASIQNQVSQ